MLLIMCHCRANRYAIDSRHVREVLPRANLHILTGSPPWLAGMLVCRRSATPVMDLSQLTEFRPCPDRLSSRIVVLKIDVEGSFRQFGVLTERVGLCEIRAAPGDSGGQSSGPSALGTLCLDEQGVFQLVAMGRLLPADRRAILFPAAGKDC